MLYESYIKIKELSYPEFMDAFSKGSIRLAVAFIITAIIFFYIGKSSQWMISKENKRKLKKICEWEKRPMRYQIKHILEMFLDHYTSKHEINWDKINY